MLLCLSMFEESGLPHSQQSLALTNMQDSSQWDTSYGVVAGIGESLLQNFREANCECEVFSVLSRVARG